MQDNTKRHFVEILSVAFIFFAIVLNITINVWLILKYAKVNEAMEKIIHEYPNLLEYLFDQNNSTDQRVSKLAEDQKNSFLELRTFFAEITPPKSPTRPNNWDNIKQAFTRPTTEKVDE
jgi:hypothetical protein